MNGRCNSFQPNFYGALVIIAALYATLFYWVPPLLDDLEFAAVYQAHNGGSAEFSLDAWAGYIQDIRSYDNSRIANILAPFSTIIQPWCTLFPFVSGAICAAMIWLITKITNIADHKAKLVALTWFLTTLFLPWRDTILVADYQLNYPYSAAITIGFVYALFRYEQTCTMTQLVLLLLFAFVAGGWHEGFAYSVIGGLFLWAASRRFRMSGRWYAVVAVYTAATIIFSLSPGILNRAANEVATTHIVNYLKLTADLSLVFIVIASIIIGLLLKSTRKHVGEALRQPLFIIFTTAMILSGILSAVISHTARTAYWPQTCAIIALLLLYRPLIVRLFEHKAISAVLCAALFALYCVHSAICISWQKKFYDENKAIVAAVESGQRTVFYNIIMPEDVPPYTLYFPTRLQWITPFHYQCLQNYYLTHDLVVVPAA